jgi:hypothetical protein
VQEAIVRRCFEWYNWRLDGIWDDHFLHDRRTVNSKNNYKPALICKIHDLKLRHYETKDPYILEGSYLWYLPISVTSPQYDVISLIIGNHFEMRYLCYLNSPPFAVDKA